MSTIPIEQHERVVQRLKLQMDDKDAEIEALTAEVSRLHDQREASWQSISELEADFKAFQKEQYASSEEKLATVGADSL